MSAMNLNSTGYHQMSHQQPAPGARIPAQLHHSMSAMNLSSTEYHQVSHQQQQQLQHPQTCLIDKKLPAIPLQPSQSVFQMQSGQGDVNSRNGALHGQPDPAASLQQVPPLRLSNERSFSNELGSYLSGQEIFQPPPPLKEATHNAAAPSTSFVSISRTMSAPMVTGDGAAPTNTLFQCQPSDSHSIVSLPSSSSISSTVPGRGYSMPPPFQTLTQGQEWTQPQVYVPQPMYVQLPSHIRNSSYTPPPPIFNVNDRVPSPSALVSSLGILSPAPETSNNIAVSNGDRSPPMSGIPVNSHGPSPSRLSSSSDESRIQHVRHLKARSQLSNGLMSGRASPSPFNNNNNSDEDYLKPLPTKSEDWAALIDTPASPTIPNSSSMRQFQNQALFSNGQYAYTDSPAEETTPSNDYMQHLTQQQTGPTPMTHRHVYQHHQHHSSGSSVPLPFTGNSGSGDPTMANGNMTIPGNHQQQRRSWSPNTLEPLDNVAMSSTSVYGFHTPPQRASNASPGPRSGSHSKQNSVFTSVSLLNDAAIVAKYRNAAIKTNDADLQLSYAKYLLEIGEPPSAEPATSAGSSAPSTENSGPASPLSEMENMGKKQLTQEAIYWIDRLAKEGQPEAQHIRGTWYEDGMYNTKKNADKALRWFQSASKGDYAPAHYKVGYYCEKRKDYNKAVVLYKKAATHNDALANHRLAIAYLYGELGQARNMKSGIQYLKRAASFATESYPKAPYVLAQILAREYKQLDIPDDIAFPDDGEALEWYKKSAELGYGPANYKLGHCYEYGTLGCTVDPFLSVQHYERAILTGDGDGEAEMALSGWYLSGAENCFEADDALAFKYASMAVEKGLPKAQYAMGYYYEIGISVPADITKATKFYKLAANNGNKEAKAALARLEQHSSFDRSEHKKSIRRIKQGRTAKNQSCALM
ncbi:hypothetical protein BGZ51_005393 [Haplosporangium sp. Z 767]|nr:hypothetical protein BGZ51_005393 [Haplosporangium sp. Z 767]KAF9181796.1 hypothetical protein BGZ50_005322 [Haplosporangium sp. Z 11]